MAKEKFEKLPKKSSKSESGKERIARFYRDINILGALALGGAAIIAPPVIAAPAAALAGLNALQAGGGELFRRYLKKRKPKNNKLLS